MSFILLLSGAQEESTSRLFREFTNQDDMASALVDHFEDYLETLAGTGDNLQYTSDDLFEFMDKTFGELVCLASETSSPDLFIPYATTWIKEAVYLYFKNSANV